jgi:hypothetical protein
VFGLAKSVGDGELDELGPSVWVHLGLPLLVGSPASEHPGCRLTGDVLAFKPVRSQVTGG